MRLLKLGLLLGIAAIHAVALPVICVPDTLTNYLTPGFSCTLGDKTFSSFSAIITATAALGVATPASTDNITVEPSGSSSDPGFGFVAAFNASTSSLISASSVTFTVAYTGFAPADDPFVQASIFLTTAAVSPPGAITAAEALCENGSFTSPLNPLLCSGVVVNSGLTSNITNANLNATATFALPAVTEIGVIKELTLDSGLGGSASASALNNGFQALAPEPGSLMLLSAGVMVLATRRCAGRKRRARRKS